MRNSHSIEQTLYLIQTLKNRLHFPSCNTFALNPPKKHRTGRKRQKVNEFSFNEGFFSMFFPPFCAPPFCMYFLDQMRGGRQLLFLPLAIFYVKRRFYRFLIFVSLFCCFLLFHYFFLEWLQREKDWRALFGEIKKSGVTIFFICINLASVISEIVHCSAKIKCRQMNTWICNKYLVI